MKAFEEWSKECPVPGVDCGTMDCRTCEKIQSKAWRAALEWAEKQETDLQATEIRNAILKELGDK